MRKNRENIFDFIVKFLLIIFLFASHTKLFYWLDPVFVSDKMVQFSYLDFNEKTIQAMIFGFLFGSITVHILDRKKDSPLFSYFVITIAILDGLVIQWLFNENFKDYWKIGFASTHYTIYTIFIILMFGFSHKKSDSHIIANDENESEKESEIAKLSEKGLSPKEISEQLNIHISTVYRKLKK